MDGKGLLIWIAGGTGVFLLYSAVSDQTPLSLIQSYLGSGKPSPFAVASAAATAPSIDRTPGGLLPPGVLPDLPPVAGPGQTPDTSPKNPYVPGGGSLSSYTGGDVYDLIDANGNNMGAIPPAYQNNPLAYVPPSGSHIQHA